MVTAALLVRPSSLTQRFDPKNHHHSYHLQQQQNVVVIIDIPNTQKNTIPNKRSSPSSASPKLAQTRPRVNGRSNHHPGAHRLVHGLDRGRTEDRRPDCSCHEEGLHSNNISVNILTISSPLLPKSKEYRLQVSLELGGKNAAVVFDDADVDAAVAGVTR